MTDGPRDDSGPSGPTDGPGAARPSAQPVGAAGTAGPGTARRPPDRTTARGSRRAGSPSPWSPCWSSPRRAGSGPSSPAPTPGILSRQVEAIVTDDTNVVTAPATPTTPPAGSYAPENILLLGFRHPRRAQPGRGQLGRQHRRRSGQLGHADARARQRRSAARAGALDPPRPQVDAPTCKQWDAATGQLSDADYPVNPGDVWHINSAYSVGGPQCTVRAVQDLTGLQIDRVIGIDFAGFQTMVDALGGITMNICGPIIDEELQTVVAEGGVQNIGGAAGAQPGPRPQGDRRHRLRPGPDPPPAGRAVLDPAAGDERRDAAESDQAGRVPAGIRAEHLHRQRDHRRPGHAGAVVRQPRSQPGHLLHVCRRCPAGDGLEPSTPPRPMRGVFAAHGRTTSRCPANQRRTETARTSSPTPRRSRCERRAPGRRSTRRRSSWRSSTGPARTGVAGNAMEELNALGFAVTEDQLRAARRAAAGVTVEYDPTNVNAARDGRGDRPRRPRWSRSTAWARPSGWCSASPSTAPSQPVAAGTAGDRHDRQRRAALPADGARRPPRPRELQSVNAGRGALRLTGRPHAGRDPPPASTTRSPRTVPTGSAGVLSWSPCGRRIRSGWPTWPNTVPRCPRSSATRCVTPPPPC